MKLTRRLIALAAAFALAIGTLPLIQVEKAHANVTVLCAPQLADTAAARTVGGSASSIPSKNVYTLNGQGCTIAAQGDVGWFLSQGFSPGPPFGANLLFTTGVAAGTTSFQIGTLPPSAYVQHIIVNNLTANAVTGNIGIGSTSGGVDIVTAAGGGLTCGANCLSFVSDALLVKRVFSTTAATPIFATAGTAWNNANVTITLVYGYF